MCQYSAKDGIASDWHVVHYGSRAVGGAAFITLEAASVSPEGRISPADIGLWNEAQIEPLARIVAFAHEHGCAVGAQLAHAGRKAGVGKGWEEKRALTKAEGGWDTLAPSALAFNADFSLPTALNLAGIAQIVDAFKQAALRALAADFSFIEIHAAHGYLLHQFLSPLANQRQDNYGGSFENRIRLLMEVVAALRSIWPESRPLFVRLSATDWAEGGWNVDESVALCKKLNANGVDLIDVSSGGLVPSETIPVGAGYQTEFSARIRREADIPTATVGLITSAAQADHIIRTGQADLVLLGRESLRNPYWPQQAADALGQTTAVSRPPQYLRAAPSGARSILTK